MKGLPNLFVEAGTGHGSAEAGRNKARDAGGAAEIQEILAKGGGKGNLVMGMATLLILGGMVACALGYWQEWRVVGKMQEGEEKRMR